MRRIDGRGSTLLPGLIDLHLHLGVPGLPTTPATATDRNVEVSGRQLLRSGVTGGRVHLMSLAAGARVKELAGDPCRPLPRLQLGGPGLAGGIPESQSPAFWGVRSAADAGNKVARIKAAGFDWLAIHDADKFAPGELGAIAQSARRQGLRLLGSGSRIAELSAVLAASPDTIDYIDRSDAPAYPAELIERMQTAKAVLVPGIGYDHRVRWFRGDPARVDHNRHFEFMSASDRLAVQALVRKELTTSDYVQISAKAFPRLALKARQLLATGLPIAAGTDVGTVPHFHSGAIWWELQAWRDLGLSPDAAITTATRTAAQVLGDPAAGHLAVGSRADFVLYRGRIERGRFDPSRVRSVARDGILFVNDGAWVGG